MKSFYVALAAIGAASAQDWSGQPKCIIPCIEDALPKVGCKLDDVACGCRPDIQEKMTPLVGMCALSKCTPAELDQAQKAAAAACAHVSSKKEEQPTSTASVPAVTSHESAAPAKSTGHVVVPTLTRCSNGTAHSTGSPINPTHTRGPAVVTAGAVAPAAGVLPVLIAAAMAL